MPVQRGKVNRVHNRHTRKRAKRENRPVKSVGVRDIKSAIVLIHIEKRLQEEFTLPEKSLLQPHFSSGATLEIRRAQFPRLNRHLRHNQFSRQFAFSLLFKARPAGCKKCYIVTSRRQTQREVMQQRLRPSQKRRSYRRY